MNKEVRGKSGTVYSFKFLNDNTKAANHWRFMSKNCNYDGNTLSSVYKNWSVYKQCAYDYCRRKAIDLDSVSRGVTCGNSQAFTFAYVFPDPETGALLLAIETRCNSYLMWWF